MKKFLAMLLSIILCLGILPTMYAETPEASFSGKYIYNIYNYLKIYIPDILEYQELTEEESNYGYKLKYASEDGTVVFSCGSYEIIDTNNIEDYRVFLENEENAENTALINKNGIEGLYFEKNGNGFYVGMHSYDGFFEEIGLTISSEQHFTKAEASQTIKEIFANIENMYVDLDSLENLKLDVENSYDGTWYTDKTINKQYYIPRDYVSKELNDEMKQYKFTSSFLSESGSQYFTVNYDDYNYQRSPLKQYMSMFILGYTDVEIIKINGNIVCFGNYNGDYVIIISEPYDNNSTRTYTLATTPNSDKDIEESITLLITVAASFKTAN